MTGQTSVRVAALSLSPRSIAMRLRSTMAVRVPENIQSLQLEEETTRTKTAHISILDRPRGLLSPVPSYLPSNSAGDSTTSWARQVAACLPTRASRASGIVATRTKISTNTIPEDAKRIDFHAGGMNSHISRHGPMVISNDLADTLPP